MRRLAAHSTDCRRFRQCGIPPVWICILYSYPVLVSCGLTPEPVLEAGLEELRYYVASATNSCLFASKDFSVSKFKTTTQQLENIGLCTGYIHIWKIIPVKFTPTLVLALRIGQTCLRGDTIDLPDRITVAKAANMVCTVVPNAHLLP